MSETKSKLEGMPPSAKFVYKTLEQANEPLTQQDLADETMMPVRTVRYGLTRLEEAGVVDRDVDLTDARRHHYTISDA